MFGEFDSNPRATDFSLWLALWSLVSAEHFEEAAPRIS